MLRPDVERVELEIRRPREDLLFLPARMFVTFYRSTGEVTQDEAEWELELDSWLLDRHVKARDPANEVLRFSLRFKAAFRPVAARFGDGFFNSVLVYLIRGGPLAGHADLRRVLEAIREYEAGGGSKHDCEDLIDHAIGTAAQRLMNLYADRSVAEDLLCRALAQYLDERFHVTERRALGMA